MAQAVTRPRRVATGVAASVLAGWAAGLLIVYLPDPAAVRALERYEPSVVTVLYDDRGERLAEWALERRQLVSYQQLPRHLREAVLAIEDARFFDHVGIDPLAVLRAVIHNITEGWGAEGASTLTMQLSRSLWLTPEKSLTRKVVEAFYYAIQTERYYSKERIFELYVNQIFMGDNVYGMGAAADHYFGKPVEEVGLAEAALLAGMIQRPNRYNPYRHPAAAVQRRNLVLDRMVEEGYLGPQEAAAAKAEPLVVAEHRPDPFAAYFVEEIRRDLIRRYGRAIYESGLQVYTTLDPELQAVAEEALDRGLREIDRRGGWRGAPRNLLDEGLDPVTYTDPGWREPPAPGRTVPALVVAVEPGRARIRVGDRLAVLEPEDVAWTRRQRLTDLLREGDLVSVRVLQVAEDGELEVELDQEPVIEGAVLVIENHTGEVKAMVGGRDFESSEFNRATQARRQTGSAFKPFVYAAALRSGRTPSDLMLDQPTTFQDPTTRQGYAPANYANEYVGVTTLAEALAKSRNVVTVMVQETVGADRVIDTARALGITAPLRPYLSLALGVIDVTLWDMTRAYAVFPNGGVRVEPHLVRRVTDRSERPLERTERQAVQVMDPDVAYLMTRMLTNVVDYPRGTGARARGLARELGRPLGGKTGTTDDYSDAWFIGFSPDHTIGVWVGYDAKRPIGPNETGSRAALPIWLEVMRAAAAGLPPRDFPQPANVVLRNVDPRTGLLSGEACATEVEMAYIAGTEPTRVCTIAEHRILAMPYYQQAYFLRDGRLQVGGGLAGFPR